MSIALIAGILALQSDWLTPRLVEAEAPWFLVPWHEWEYTAFEQAAKNNRPVLIWTPTRSLHKFPTPSSLAERAALLNTPIAIQLAKSGVEPVQGPGIGAVLEPQMSLTGVLIYLPDGTFVGNATGDKISDWPKIARQAQELIKAHKGGWDVADLSHNGDFGFLIDTSVWCYSTQQDSNGRLGFMKWEFSPDIWDEVFRTRARYGYPVKDFIRTCLFDSSLPDQERWSEGDITQLRIQQTADRELNVSLSLESERRKLKA